LWYLIVKSEGDEGDERDEAKEAQKRTRHLYPLAVEWGSQALASDDDKRLNYALATGLSTTCRLLDVDLVRAHNTGANPFWGQTGHYSIATAAIESVTQGPLRDFLEANVERISFRPNELTPEQIREKLARGDFVELADVPDLVWKKTSNRVPGGRDYAQNAGPEHPNHYADIDQPDGDGKTLRDVTLSNISNMSVAVLAKWYADEGQADVRSQGLLPFRVWQIFDEMVKQLKAHNNTKFLCAAGVLAHYVGDACQPLHGSYHSDGYKDAPGATSKKWPGKGVQTRAELPPPRRMYSSINVPGGRICAAWLISVTVANAASRPFAILGISPSNAFACGAIIAARKRAPAPISGVSGQAVSAVADARPDRARDRLMD
jgi:hypothetical protein